MPWKSGSFLQLTDTWILWKKRINYKEQCVYLSLINQSCGECRTAYHGGRRRNRGGLGRHCGGKWRRRRVRGKSWRRRRQGRGLGQWRGRVGRNRPREWWILEPWVWERRASNRGEVPRENGIWTSGPALGSPWQWCWRCAERESLRQKKVFVWLVFRSLKWEGTIIFIIDTNKHTDQI